MTDWTPREYEPTQRLAYYDIGEDEAHDGDELRNADRNDGGRTKNQP